MDTKKVTPFFVYLGRVFLSFGILCAFRGMADASYYRLSN